MNIEPILNSGRDSKTVVLTCKVDGSVSDIKVKLSSDNELMDATAVKAVVDAAPYALPPLDASLLPITIELTFARKVE